jgi:hypothetical protein
MGATPGGTIVDKECACKIEGCKRPYRAKGYCNVHYKKWRQGEFGKTRYKQCKMEGCAKRRHQQAYCEEHFNSEVLKKSAAGEKAA